MVWSKDGLAAKVTESAMCVTRGVVDAQNAQRKAFMEHLRRAQAQQAAAAQAWQRLIDTYTHEQGTHNYYKYSLIAFHSAVNMSTSFCFIPSNNIGVYPAVWHDPRSYPTSWQLDPTEGPGRVRVRLRRAHLHINPKFLKPQYQHKAGEHGLPV